MPNYQSLVFSIVLTFVLCHDFMQSQFQGTKCTYHGKNNGCIVTTCTLLCNGSKYKCNDNHTESMESLNCEENEVLYVKKHKKSKPCDQLKECLNVTRVSCSHNECGSGKYCEKKTGKCIPCKLCGVDYFQDPTQPCLLQCLQGPYVNKAVSSTKSVDMEVSKILGNLTSHYTSTTRTKIEKIQLMDGTIRENQVNVNISLRTAMFMSIILASVVVTAISIVLVFSMCILFGKIIKWYMYKKRGYGYVNNPYSTESRKQSEKEYLSDIIIVHKPPGKLSEVILDDLVTITSETVSIRNHSDETSPKQIDDRISSTIDEPEFDFVKQDILDLNSIDLHKQSNVSTYTISPEQRYELFKEAIERNKVPDFVHKTTFEWGKIKIYIDPGKIKACQEYIHEAAARFEINDILEIKEVSALWAGIFKTKIRNIPRNAYCLQSTTFSEGSAILLLPDESYEKICQSQNVKDIQHIQSLCPELIEQELQMGTIGGFFKDDKHIYALSTQHIVNERVTGFQTNSKRAKDFKLCTFFRHPLLSGVSQRKSVYPDDTCRNSVICMGKERFGILCTDGKCDQKREEQQREVSLGAVGGPYQATRCHHSSASHYGIIDIVLFKFDNTDFLDKPYFNPNVNHQFPPDGMIKVDQHVQKIGAMTGLTKGRIYEVDFDLGQNNELPCKGSFAVITIENKPFVSGGDSGSVVTLLQHGQTYVLGIVYKIIGERAICVNFKYCFEKLREEMKEEFRKEMGSEKGEEMGSNIDFVRKVDIKPSSAFTSLGSMSLDSGYGEEYNSY